MFVFLRTEAKGHMITEGRLITLLENIKRKAEDKTEHFRGGKRNWDEIAMLGGQFEKLGVTRIHRNIG